MRVAIVLFCLFSVAIAGEPPGAYHTDTTWGFKVKTPKGWSQAAVADDTPWICAKHLGKRELEGRLVDKDWMTLEAPEMWVLGFPHTDAGVKNPYADYRAYLAGNGDFIDFTGDKYRIVGEKQTTVGGVKVDTFDIRLGAKKKTGRHVVAWVFHFEDIDFAVQFKVLEWHYADYKSTFKACLKSFKRVQRIKALGGSRSGSAETVRTRAELWALPPGEQATAFEEGVEASFARTIEGLPADWSHKRAKRCLVLTNADKKFVGVAVKHADAVLAHLDKMFAVKGAQKKEFTPPYLLRIFATDEQYRAYGKENESTGAIVRDIAIYSGKGYVKDNAFEILNEALWSIWLEERHPQLEGWLPEWFEEGFGKYMRMLRSKGKKVGFGNEDWDRDSIRLQIKKGRHEDVRAILCRGITDEGVSNAEMESYERSLQIRSFVMWLMRGGNKGRTKNVVRDFVLNIERNLLAAEAEWEQKNPAGPKSQPGERREIRNGAISSQRKALVKNAWTETFGAWKAADWKKINKSWMEAVK